MINQSETESQHVLNNKLYIIFVNRIYDVKKNEIRCLTFEYRNPNTIFESIKIEI